jgi:hypothetical protein
MASQLRVNKSENRSGLGTITYTDTGAIVSGIVTANSFSGDIIGNITGAVTGTTGSFSGDVSIAEKIIHTGDTNTFMKFDTDTVTFETAGDERFRITSAGKVLIGDGTTYNPQGLLHIVGDDNSNGPELYLQVNNNNTTDNIGALWFGNNVDKSLVKLAGHTHSANNTADFTVSTSNGGTLGERLRIKSDGTVGINVANPDSTFKLDLNGKLRVGSGSAGQHVMWSRAGLTAELVIGVDGYGNAVNNEATIQSGTGRPLVFMTNGGERLRITSGGAVLIKATSTSNSETFRIHEGDSGKVIIKLTNATTGTAAGDGFEFGLNSNEQIEFFNKENTDMFFGTNNLERLRIQSDGNVGIARTVNNWNTSNTSSLYDLSINRESNNSAGGGLNKSLNVDNQYTVQTFRSTNTNRNGTQAWFDIAHFRAWDINAKVIIQSGGTFTGDQVEIKVISSYNSALNNNRSGPYLEVKSTQAHTARRFTKVKLGCNNSNRQPILQVYLDGNATHNANGYINVTVYDYGSAYGTNTHRGEAKFATATTLNETWKELKIYDGTNDSGTLISDPQGIVLDSVISTGSKTITGGNNLAIQNFKVKGVYSGSGSIGKSIELISGYDSEVKMAAIGYNLTDVNTGSTYGGDLTLHTQPLYSSPTTPLPVRMRVSSSGYVTTPQNPKFWYSSLSNASSSSATNNTEILKFATERHNQGSNYNTSNGRFTAPVSGTYHFTFNGLVDNSGSNSHFWAQLWRNGSNITNVGYTFSNNGEYTGFGGSACIYLAKDDYAQIYASANIHVGNETSFSGHLIG